MRPRRPACVAVAGLVLLVLLTGCGSDPDPGAGSSTGPGTGSSTGSSTGPVASRSLAAVVADHAGKPRSSKSYDGSGFGPEGVGTEVSYRDGGSVSLVVGQRPWADAFDCASPPPYAPGCATVDGVVVVWAKEEPEEDPGIIHLYLDKDGAGVLLTYAGPRITGDPRELDLPIDLDTLVAIVRDPRVH